MIDGQELLARMEALEPDERRIVLDGSPEAVVRGFDGGWPIWAHEGQLPTDGDWRVWVMLAGRGFGKTRAGAEWVSELARRTPDARIALVAASVDEARAVMVEGKSGLIAAAQAGEERDRLAWEPSQRRLRFASGAEAYVYSGSNPEALRGPEHHFAWCDELAKWRRAEAAWDNLMLGLRLAPSTGSGQGRPRALVTTTPRAVKVLRRILGEEGVVRTGGAMWANAHLPETFLRAAEAAYGGTRFGRQELEGVLIEDVEGALWKRELIERCRTHPAAAQPPLHHASHCPPPLQMQGRIESRRVVIGVDPPASVEGDACGIVAVGLGKDGIGYVLADHSVGGLSPEGWARKVAAAAEAWRADRIVAEANNGGAMVESVLRGAGMRLPVKRVHAAIGKAARAEPVAALFESGQAKLAGRFPELEDELAGLQVSGGYQGPGRSPDRADAMVWALTELMLGEAKAEPRVTLL